MQYVILERLNDWFIPCPLNVMRRERRGLGSVNWRVPPFLNLGVCFPGSLIRVIAQQLGHWKDKNHWTLEMYFTHKSSTLLINTSKCLGVWEKAMELYVGYTHYESDQFDENSWEKELQNVELVTWKTLSLSLINHEKLITYIYETRKNIFYSLIKKHLCYSEVCQTYLLVLQLKVFIYEIILIFIMIWK